MFILLSFVKICMSILEFYEIVLQFWKALFYILITFRSKSPWIQSDTTRPCIEKLQGGTLEFIWNSPFSKIPCTACARRARRAHERRPTAGWVNCEQIPRYVQLYSLTSINHMGKSNRIFSESSCPLIIFNSVFTIISVTRATQNSRQN